MAGTTIIGLTPTAPPAQPAGSGVHTPRITYQDCIDRLVDYLGASVNPEAVRECRRAILAAYRELPTRHQWTYLLTHGRLFTNGQFVTGTVQYQHTAGQFPRQLTLTGATWPSFTQFGTIRIGTVTYDVSQVMSPTVVQLDPVINPGVDGDANIPAGTAYTLYRDTYTLPSDFIAGDRAFAEISWGSMLFVHISSWIQVTRYYLSSSNTPRYYCVPTDHEILTRRGWKRHHELLIGEEVLAYCHQTGELAWQPLEDVAVFDFDGKLLALERRKSRKQFLFTEDHRWPVKMRKGTRKILRSHELTGASLIPQKGEFRDDGTSILNPRLAAILGWVVTDGTGLFAKDHWNAKVYQSPRKHLDEIVKLLGTKRRKPMPNGVVAVPVSAKDRAALRAVIRRREDLPAVVAKLSRAAAEAMWQAMFHAEGWTTATGQQGFAQYPDYNEPVIEAFQILCLLTGKSFHINRYKDRLAGSVTKATYLAPDKSGGLKRRKYKGLVWCPKTPWGTWVMRHNGHVIITGNTFTGDPRNPGLLALRIFPYPDIDRTLDFVYKRQPRLLQIPNYSVGNATVSGFGSTTVTGFGTNWTAAMVGSVIRLSATSSPPTGLDGINPYTEERTILAAPNGTTLNVDAPFTLAYTNSPYVISDPIDFDSGNSGSTIFDAFFRACEMYLCTQRTMKNKPDAQAAYALALEIAKENDSRSFAGRTCGPEGPYRQRLARMPSGPDVS